MLQIEKNGMAYDVEPGMLVAFWYRKGFETTARQGKVIPNAPSLRKNGRKYLTIKTAEGRIRAFKGSEIVGSISEI
jgi:hypothetical protein